MHQQDLTGKGLRCSFCRNPLDNDHINVKEYKGDFVSVQCDHCQDLLNNNDKLGPKYLVCLCSDTPRELSLEMGESEINAGNIPKFETNKEVVANYLDSTINYETSKASNRNKKMSKL